MDISEVARRSGTAASALRFYEAKGLIRSSGRRGLRRQYDAGVLEQLALMTLGRAAGLSLEEIGRMLTVGERARVDRTVLAARADECDEQIRRLTTIRDGLRHASACPADDHLACPKFRRLMGLAVLRAAGISAKRASPRRSPGERRSRR
jgi:DNA-binding transcriptional MerR regulator